MRTLIIVTLIGVFCLCYFEMTFADITIDGQTLHVETNNYEVRFEYGAITYLHNKLTNETYTLPLQPIFEQSAAILSRNKHFYARRADTVETRKINQHIAETRFQQGENEIRIVVAIDPDTQDLLVSGDGAADTPGVYAIQWGITNLNLENLRLITPSEKMPLIDAYSAIDHRMFKYPTTSWEAQLAIIEAQHGGFYLRSTDTTFRFKTMLYNRYANNHGLSISTENQAPWDMLTAATSVTWRLNTYTGDWRVPAQIHRDWMEQTFDPWRLSDMPSWVQGINLVVLHKKLDKEVLKPLAEMVDPTKTLLYLTDWREGGRGVNKPNYSNPHEKFDAFVKIARWHGFRIMLDVNIYSCSVSHPLYLDLKRFQYRRPETGELSGWLWEEIGHPGRNAHISLASSQFRNLLVQQFKAIWEQYHIDAFFLDVSHYVLNDANGLIEGLTSAEGNVLIHKELAQAMPGVVFSGEGLHEVTFFRESFAKHHVIKGSFHPISTFLFSSYTRFHGGDATPGIGSPDYPFFLDNFKSQGLLPTLVVGAERVLNDTRGQDMLSFAREWQAPNIIFSLDPDINHDGQINVLDLILIGNKFGQQVSQGTPEDLNGDGVINILDLTLLAQNMN